MIEQQMCRKVTLTIPAQADFVELVRLTLYGIANKMGFSYEEIEDMKVAISEACNNAVLYAYEEEQGMVDLVFEMEEKELRIIVRDHGTSFDVEKEATGKESLHHKQLEEVQAGGLGFYLMQALMDHVEIISLEGRGTEVRMRKRVQFVEDSQ